MTLETLVPNVGLPSEVLGVTVLRSGRPGPRVGVMAALHGDEFVGLAVWPFLKEIGPPIHGEIHLIVGHPEALASGARSIGRDINRLFTDDRNKVPNDLGPDQARCEQLKPILRTLDVLIDIHSTSEPTEPFLIDCPIGAANCGLLDCLPMAQIHGLGDMVRGTAAAYVTQRGGLGVTVEVGQHRLASGPDIACDAVLRVLQYLGQVPCRMSHPWIGQAYTKRHIAAIGAVKCKGYGFQYAFAPSNFQRLRPGQIIAWDSELIYRAPDILHAMMVLPTAPQRLCKKTNAYAFFIGIDLGSIPSLRHRLTAFENDEPRVLSAKAIAHRGSDSELTLGQHNSNLER